MKRAFSRLILGTIILCGTLGHLSAQSETDAYRMSQRDLSGTARFRSMAGAFVALGGDASAVERNPASTAVFHGSEISFTFGGKINTNNTNWNGNSLLDSKFSMKDTQFGFVHAYYNERTGNGFSVGLNYNRPLNIDRNIRAENNSPMKFSLADYVAFSTPDNLSRDDMTPSNSYDPYRQPIPWFSILGLNAGWIIPTKKDKGPYESTFIYPSGGKSLAFGPAAANIQMHEQAHIGETDFSFGFNYQDRLYTGISVKLINVNYTLSTFYNEKFIEGDYLKLENTLSTKGNGFGLSIGFIGRPTDNLRLGIAFHSPTRLFLMDTYESFGSSRYSYALDESGKPFPPDKWVVSGSTPTGAYSSYRVSVPPRIAMGAAYTFENYGLISFDYELAPYGSMTLYDNQGKKYNIDNAAISNHYGIKHTIRLGVEVKPLPQLALRAGYLHASAPMKKGSGLTEFDAHSTTPMLTAGTIPHYIIPGATNTFTAGLGYRITPKFYTDLSFVYNSQKQYLYTFPTINNSEGKTLANAPAPAAIANSNYNFNITFGYRF